MFTLASILIALQLSLLSLVHAHGHLRSIEVNNKLYPAWEIRADDQIHPTPLRYARRVENEGAVKDFTTKAITCGEGGNVPAQGLIPVKGGGKVKFIMDQWGSSHSGPIMTYMAKCTPSCASFKGDSGPVWVKIAQEAFNKTGNPQWASDKLPRQGAAWTVTVPESLQAGEWLMRFEILGLHVAGKRMGAQFYPYCAQVKLESSGTANPKGIALPGAYNPDDKKGIQVELWRINQGQVDYVAPGGPVWEGASKRM